MASATEQLKRGALVVGVFAVIGLGIGLTAYFPISYLNETFSGGFVGPILGAVIGLQSVLLVVFVAPVVAAIAGLLNGYTDQNPWASAITSGSGAFVGFYVMLLFAGLLVGGAVTGGDAVGGETTADPVAAPFTPTPFDTVYTPQLTYITETPETPIETATPTPTSAPTPNHPFGEYQSGAEALLVGGIPAGMVGAVTAGVGYWFRENNDIG